MQGSDPAYAKRTGRALASADFVFADSNLVLERCNILAGHNLPSMRVPLGIDLERFHPGFAVESQAWRRELGIPNGSRILLSMRGWKREHRHEMILHAFSQARRSLGIPTFLIFMRYNVEDNRYEHEVRVEAEELGIADYVRWVDSVPHDRMPELYAMADAMVSYPTVDSIPTGFIEAAACGKTVICSRLASYEGAIPEDVFRLVSPDSVQELAHAMAEVLHEPTREAAAKGERAREWARRTGDERVCIRQIMAIYKKLVSG
jgi:glycosyltransferase involved in cell wall biosynthesis